MHGKFVPFTLCTACTYTTQLYVCAAAAAAGKVADLIREGFLTSILALWVRHGALSLCSCCWLEKASLLLAPTKQHCMGICLKFMREKRTHKHAHTHTHTHTHTHKHTNTPHTTHTHTHTYTHTHTHTHHKPTHTHKHIQVRFKVGYLQTLCSQHAFFICVLSVTTITMQLTLPSYWGSTIKGKIERVS